MTSSTGLSPVRCLRDLAPMNSVFRRCFTLGAVSLLVAQIGRRPQDIAGVNRGYVAFSEQRQRVRLNR
jgi:hypothetical protein